ncbi:MAG: 4Fe-4S dicluster domain-containing protein [Candidatus Asgardarchaeia archaeon]|nr:4Fe-4S dicluster domain-containing protein [Candidatus Odinarchaeota archaeon]
MRILKLKKEDLPSFLESVKKFGKLVGPIRKGSKLVFDEIDDYNMLVLTAEKPMIPPKKFFVPPKFSMFKFDKNGFENNLGKSEKLIIFGLHPCDIHAINILDKFFLKNAGYTDPYYEERRKNTIIIGHSCIPNEKCLCNATHTDIVYEGFDLFFTDLGDFYLIWVATSVGDDLTREKIEIFDEDIKPQDIKRYIDWRDQRNSKFTVNMDFRIMPDIMEISYDSKVWDEMAEKCLSCGSCTMVCPTCNCYNVVDELEVSTEIKGERVRYWDSCMFREYSLVAGGHNFREARADRLKLWYTHKLRAYMEAYGSPGCVGCGRCVEYCPVDINVLSVARALLREREVYKEC